MRLHPTDSRLHLRGAIRTQLVDAALRIDRPIADEGGLGADAPGAMVGLVTDADNMTVHLRRNGRHLRQDAVNRTVIITDQGRILARGEIPADSKAEFKWAAMLPPTPTPRMLYFHFPYGESVDLVAIGLPDGTRIEPPGDHGDDCRWLACGDSITQGFHASSPLHSYPALLAASRCWEVLNAGVGGRCIEAEDGAALASIQADLVTVLLGYNDYGHQREPADSALKLTRMLHALRTGGDPQRPIFVITPLWSSADGPGVKGYSLADYRRAISIATESLADPATRVIDGEPLLAHRPGLFSDGIHPNDAGFAVLAAALSPHLPETKPRFLQPAWKPPGKDSASTGPHGLTTGLTT